MSLQKDLFRKKILEQEAKMRAISGDDAFFNTGEEDFEEELEDTLAPLSSMPPPARQSRLPKNSIQAVSWDQYFDQNFIIEHTVDGSVVRFNIYYSPPSGPEAPIFFFHHGAGSSGLTFALLAKTLRSQMKDQSKGEVAGVVVFDMRGHGKTTVDGPNASDLSLNTLSRDMIDVFRLMKEKENWDDIPLILVGHSLGGAVVSKACSEFKFPHLVGACVIDAVEEPALMSLKSMHSVLDGFPPKFQNISSAIDWHLKNFSLHSKEAAAVSVPGILKPIGNKDEVTWITDLRSTEPYWTGWYLGLSSNFLEIPAARLLILAGTDRLDKKLMIGQMQGKYQLVVFAESGHFVQEDVPMKTAVTLIDFLIRNGKPVKITPVFGAFREKE